VILSHVLTPKILAQRDYAYQPRTQIFPQKTEKRPGKAADPTRRSKTDSSLPYRPAAAAEVIIPAICMPSIRASTFSRLAPVSVHAST